jgi:hypothetical protein
MNDKKVYNELGEHSTDYYLIKAQINLKGALLKCRSEEGRSHIRKEIERLDLIINIIKGG